MLLGTVCTNIMISSWKIYCVRESMYVREREPERVRVFFDRIKEREMCCFSARRNEGEMKHCL
jgi:hypothetical protein